jgi:hypothetical protein
MKFFRMVLGSKKEKLSLEDERQVQDPPAGDIPEPQGQASEDAYWFFLSYFLDAKDIEKDKFIASWSESLGRSYKAVIKESLNNGLMMRAGVREKLAGKLRAQDLKKLLSEQGLSASGTKGDLLDCYIEALPKEAEKEVSKMAGDFLLCTPKGREQVELHERRVADTQDSAQLEMKRLLTRGRVDQAAEVVNIYLGSAGRSLRDNYNDWTKKDIKTILDIKKVRGLAEAELEEARVNSVMELLWYGEMKSAEYSHIPSFHKFAKAASLVIGRKRSREDLKGYSENECITRVEIMCNDDSCPKCKAACGEYLLKEAPLLPIKGCTHEDGCRCSYTPVVD